MNIRAVIFDVYGTLLQLTQPPANPQAAWHLLSQQMLASAPSLSWAEFISACERSIARRHAFARERGIRYPEILWPSVVAEVLPEFSKLTPAQRDEFIYRQMQIQHTVRLLPEAANTLRLLHENRCLLGIASNGQHYTFRELRECFEPHQLDPALFDPDLCFWSFAHGFSKPDPYVFEILTTRLEQRGIPPQQCLMVGDSIPSDLLPAQAFGWQTWHFKDWEPLAQHLQQATVLP